jgi:RNA polymerase sigma-70 factor (ECF subfamily)
MGGVVIDLLAVMAVLGGPRPARPDPDRDAGFEEIYGRHVDAVYARLTRLIGPVPEREDLTQEVFLGLHRALPGFRGDAALSTLIYRITVNVACEHLRRRARRPTVGLDDATLAALVAPEPTPEATARRREEVARVLRALDRIKPRKRVALLLRVVDGLSLEEIGALVDASPETVAKRVQHGMRELTAHLARAEAKEAAR